MKIEREGIVGYRKMHIVHCLRTNEEERERERDKDEACIKYTYFAQL